MLGRLVAGDGWPGRLGFVQPARESYSSDDIFMQICNISAENSNNVCLQPSARSATALFSPAVIPVSIYLEFPEITVFKKKQQNYQAPTN